MLVRRDHEKQESSIQASAVSRKDSSMGLKQLNMELVRI